MNTFTLKTTKKIFPILALTLLAITACNKKNNSQLSGTAYIQVTNASQADSPMDFYVGSTKKNTLPLPYTQSTNYFSVDAGKQQSAAFKTSSTGNTLAGFQITPLPNVYYSIFRFGSNTVSYIDDVSIAAGKARVRFINLNLDLVDNLDFGITGAGAPLTTGLSPALDSKYYSVAPGSSFSVYIAGTNTSMLDIPTSVEAGHVYTVYLSGTLKADLKATVLLQK
ncbi:DUF4397 domain-containing protein [Mucilaginibacter panaciglaebae]|uniref:DUF4397 domain-containing protein n=1 Tax=Mucilaginibacter panaciglaebae TaxID=502331 RepID=A0ABP7WBP3_9SPHI